jgi:hypothetical protein
VSHLTIYALRLECFAGRSFALAPGEAANMLRGQLGKLLFKKDPAAYARYFKPIQSVGEGPSGFRDLPRPFVLRVAHLDGVRLSGGDRFGIGLNVFDLTAVPLFRELLAEAAQHLFGAAKLDGDASELVTVSLVPHSLEVKRARVEFLTPTELKGADRPDFGALFERIRDRLSLLRTHYGDGPLEIDFREMGERARQVRMTRCEIEMKTTVRRSRATGQTHPLSGFTGLAEYEGDLTEFLPYLEAARWTGVGRQTVWGKGEIRCEPL